MSSSIELRSLPFVDRVNECRLICHPDIRSLRDDKGCCVAVSKQPGAGKTSLGKECLKVALDNPPEGHTMEEWQAMLPVCTLYCEAKDQERLDDVLRRVACYAAAKLDELRMDLSKIERGNRCEVVPVDYEVQDTEEPLPAGKVVDYVDDLETKVSFLCISEDTKKRLDSIARDLVLRLNKQPVTEWRKTIGEIVEDPFDAHEIADLLIVRAVAVDLADICSKWSKAYGRKSPLAALLIVVDEAQWVLPGKERQTEERQVLRARQQVEGRFEMMRPVFAETRFLWTGVDLQMSSGDQTTSFRVISLALPPLDVEQWEEALDTRSSEEAESLMEQMIGKFKKLERIRIAWADIMNDPGEIRHQVLMEMMSCTGGWPREIYHFVGRPNTKERDWMYRVFGSAERKQRMQDATVELLDLVYMHPKRSAWDLLDTVKHSAAAEEGRVFYELLHLSGLQLIEDDGENPAIYVPDNGRQVVGVTTIGSLTKARLRHTTGSLLLQARLRSQTEAVYAERGAWAAFAHDVAQEATVNILSHLDAFCGRQLKQVFPWLRNAPSEFGDKPLESGDLHAFRGLVVNNYQGASEPGCVPVDLKDHGDAGQVMSEPFKKWLEEQHAGGDESFAPFLYVFGPQSTSGDVLFVMKDLHIHMQIKNAKKKQDWEAACEKMKAVSSEKVASIFVLVNYYDQENQRPMPFVKMSTRSYAAIRGICREAGTADVDDSSGFSENCLLVDLEDIWIKRRKRNALGITELTPSRVLATPEAAAASESEALEKPRKKRRPTYGSCGPRIVASTGPSIGQDQPLDIPKNGYAVYRQSDGSKFKGMMKDGQKHGKAEVEYANGDRWEGRYVEGEKQVYGKYTYASGECCEGELNSSENLDGWGKRTWPHGDVYCGQFEAGYLSGYGRYCSCNRDKYIGEWKENKRNGYGENIWRSGHEYKGWWKDDRLHGVGRLITSGKDGAYFCGRATHGIWENGHRVTRFKSCQDADKYKKDHRLQEPFPPEMPKWLKDMIEA